MKKECGDAPFWTGHGYRQIVQKTGRHGLFAVNREHVHMKTAKRPSERQPGHILAKIASTPSFFISR